MTTPVGATAPQRPEADETFSQSYSTSERIQGIVSSVFLAIAMTPFIAVPVAIWFFATPVLPTVLIGVVVTIIAIAIYLLLSSSPSDSKEARTPSPDGSYASSETASDSDTESAPGVRHSSRRSSTHFKGPASFETVRVAVDKGLELEGLTRAGKVGPELYIPTATDDWKDLKKVNWDALPIGFNNGGGNDCCIVTAIQFIIAHPQDAKNFYDDLTGLLQAYQKLATLVPIAKLSLSEDQVKKSVKIVEEALKAFTTVLEDRSQGKSYSSANSMAIRALLPLWSDNADFYNTSSRQLDASEIANILIQSSFISRELKGAALFRETSHVERVQENAGSCETSAKRNNNCTLIEEEGTFYRDVPPETHIVIKLPKPVRGKIESIPFQQILGSHFNTANENGESEPCKGYSFGDLENANYHTYRIKRRELSLREYPETLVMQFARHVFLLRDPQNPKKGGTPYKNSNQITGVPWILGFNEGKPVQNPFADEADTFYHLTSFIHHGGESGGGHYKAYTRHCDTNGNYQWYQINDGTRSAMSAKQIRTILDTETIYQVRFTRKAPDA